MLNALIVGLIAIMCARLRNVNCFLLRFESSVN